MVDPVKSHLLPSLLVRLTDDEPKNKQPEPVSKQVMNEEEYLKAFNEDLQWLFNATSLEASVDLDRYDFVDENGQTRNYLKESVINFGIQDLTGHTASRVKTNKIEERLRLAIEYFEPRILLDKLKIEARRTDQYNQNALSFDIRGELWMQPSPWPQHWQTDVDLETGSVTVKFSGQGL
jgi:type VI secretion system protein ImpF